MNEVVKSEPQSSIPKSDGETAAIEFHKRMMDANKLINEESNRLITWSLSAVGGSVLTIISSEYVRPDRPILYTYFLFLIGWSCLGVSIYLGEMLTRIYIAGSIALEDDSTRMRGIGIEMNQAFNTQLNCFYWGMIVFAVWLVAFLTWFVIYKH